MLDKFVTVGKRVVDKSKKYEVRKVITANDKDIVEIELNTVNARAYIGDFYGLLMTLKIDRHLWNEVMDLNNIRCSSDYNGNIHVLKTFGTTTIQKTNM
jgi:hypothetical protein